ncbi:hypothetical protein ACH5RR_014627 [Cinchona calisaya]|uniref:Uncharacterized protein n=1 Tax=Cinchona calisaya TaxID=153742 RepID=A0ABD2ZW31_9GENT
MAEKGGKGFSLPKGKDDDSAKSKKGRKVQIDFEDSLEPISPKTNGRVNTPIYKGDKAAAGGKGDKAAAGGKGDKAATGGKNSMKKAPSSEFKIDEELAKDTKCLMDCEAAEIFQGIQDKMVIISADPAIKISVSFDWGLTYAKRSGVYPYPLTVQKILEPLKKLGVSDGEICMIANLKVESDDEVFALVPTLKGKKGKLREPLKCALNDLAKLQSSV